MLLLPERAVYRPEKQQLIISDVHLGKAAHFRKEGLALPSHSAMRDIDKLDHLLRKWKPASVIILGDLFHSFVNKEWLLFKALLLDHSYIRFILVEGNHDLLSIEEYDIVNFFTSDLLIDEHFIFSHHPVENLPKLNICGHIHPGVRISGPARQSERLSCFYLNKTHFILPAFGYLTGLQLLEIEENSDYFLVTGNRVVKL